MPVGRVPDVEAKKGSPTARPEATESERVFVVLYAKRIVLASSSRRTRINRNAARS